MHLPEIITISGVDGSGKSVNARFIVEELKKRKLRTHFVHAGASVSIQPPSYNSPISWSTAYLIFLKDMICIWYQILLHVNSDVMVFDRYIYDTVVKITYRQHRTTSAPILCMMMRLLPQPSLGFICSATPRTTYQRDNDHTFEYHKKKYQLYKQMRTSLYHLKTLTTEQSIAHIQHTITRHIVRMFS
jgi:thymidylate kinase